MAGMQGLAWLEAKGLHSRFMMGAVRYFLYSLLGLMALGMLAILGGAGFIAILLAQYSHDLPDYSQLKDYNPPVVSRLYAGDGRLVAEFATEKRIFIPIEAVPDRVKQAFIAAEDQNFYAHEGIDLTAIIRAALSNLQHKVDGGTSLQGGSTITQQVTKNFLLTNDRTMERKIREAILARRIEQAMSKDRLLELYLNQIYLGDGSYGVVAAALDYFNKSLDELTLAETAYLAALPKAPANYHPTRHREAALARRNWVLSRMAKDKYITADEAALAKAEPLQVFERDPMQVVEAPYFVEEVRRELMARYGAKDLYGGGLVVRSTLDPRLQDMAVRALHKGLMEYDHRHGWRGPVAHLEMTEGWPAALIAQKSPVDMLPTWKLAVVLDVSDKVASLGLMEDKRGTLPLENVRWARSSVNNEGYQLGAEIVSVSQVVKKGDIIMVEAIKDTYALRQIPAVQGALLALDPRTGRVLAMQGGWSQASSEFNRATQALRQPGSAFKPFVYIAALEAGLTPATLIMDAPFSIQDRPGNLWSPENYDGEFYGPTPLRVGIEKSRNVMTVRLADYLGMDAIVERAKRFGVAENMPPFLSASLGSMETTLLNLVRAYAVFASGGKAIVPTFIDRVQDRRGITVFKSDTRVCATCGPMVEWAETIKPPILGDERKQLVDPAINYQMISILQGVVQRGTAARLSKLGRPLAGKTGTTNSSRDTWFVGFSPELVAGVWVGFDAPRSVGKRETGASTAVPIFEAFMEEALQGVPPAPFPVPRGIRNIQINKATGTRAGPMDSNVMWEVFTESAEPDENVRMLDNKTLNVEHTPEEPEVMDFSAPPPPSADPTDTGTGGIY